MEESPERTRGESNISPTAHRRLATLARFFSGLSIRKQDSEETIEETHGPYGLNVLFDPPEPLADVIFVHGLGGGSRKTWDKGRDPQLYWPKEWLSRDVEFKNVRIQTFGYHADWTERRESIPNIHDFANSLLAQLQTSPAVRRSKDVPLVFVCHSMGGLVVKRAYILSQVDPEFEFLGKRFNAIYFLATPHQGASSARLLNNLIRIAQVGSKPFLADLRLDSPAIQSINDEFRRYSSKIRLYSFFETLPTNIMGMGHLFVVDKASATMQLPNERVSPLRADHPGICKYLSPTDYNYILVRDSIVETLDIVKENWNEKNKAVLKKQKRTLRQFLHASDQIQNCHLDFDESPVNGSCEWLTFEPGLRRWCDTSKPRIFFLNGAPGTGKTFLAKHIAGHVSDLGFDCSSFFFRSGHAARSSIGGCLLSLAWQMAHNNAAVRDIFLKMHEDETEFDSEDFHSIWRTLFMGGIFQAKLERPHFWVLDGLDECADHNELFPLLAKINAGFPLQIFLASRTSPEVRNAMSYYGLGVEDCPIECEKTAEDIKRYVHSHANYPGMQREAQRDEITSVILEKSGGSFVWVRLVMEELRTVFSEEATRAVLENVPKGMNQIYLRSLQPGEAFNLVKDHVSWLCGHLGTVDSSSFVNMIHETARRFILDPSKNSPITFNEAESHERLAFVCLKYLTDKELKAPRGRRATVTTRSPFFNYASTSFHEHLDKSKSTSEELCDLLYGFCSSSSGNILTWIEQVTSADEGISIITRAGMSVRSFVVRMSQILEKRTEKLDVIDTWGKDLTRVATKFGRCLLQSPNSIYAFIPSFCPRETAIHRQFGSGQRSVNLQGLISWREWDDCLAKIAYKKNRSRAVSVAATKSHFAVGMSNSQFHLYHVNTCQEYAILLHGEVVKVAYFNLTSQWIATSGRKRLCLWHVSTGKLAWTCDIASQCMKMAFSEDSSELVIVCLDNRLQYYDVQTGILRDTVPWYIDDDSDIIANTPAAAAISYQHQLLAFTYKGSHIYLWDLETDELLGSCNKPGAKSRTYPLHATSMVFSTALNSNCLAASYGQGEILVFDPLEGEVKARYKGQTCDQFLACSPDGRTLAAGDSSGVIRIFDFQPFDFADRKLRMLYMISGVEENISSLAFCDNNRFVDIRGTKAKVWEPTVLVHQDLTVSDTESLDSTETLIQKNQEVSETDPITAITIHPKGQHVFCATENGMIQVYDTSTGECTQTISQLSPGDTILLMTFSKVEDILVNAGISSRVVVRRLSFRREWRIESKVFEHRMGERIEQLLFNETATRVLIVTSTRDMVYSLIDGLTSSYEWETRLPGVWCNDPRDPELLLLWVNKSLRVFRWRDLEQVTPGHSLKLYFDLPDGFGIKTVYSGSMGTLVATVFTEVGRARSSTKLLLWDAKDFSTISLAPDDTVMPHASLQNYSDIISRLVGNTGVIIGIFNNRVLFQDHDGWLCSIFLEEKAEPGSYSRHFFLPVEWLSTDENPLLDFVAAKSQVLFAKGSELAVIKRGLDISQEMSLLETGS